MTEPDFGEQEPEITAEPYPWWFSDDGTINGPGLRLCLLASMGLSIDTTNPKTMVDCLEAAFQWVLGAQPVAPAAKLTPIKGGRG